MDKIDKKSIVKGIFYIFLSISFMLLTAFVTVSEEDRYIQLCQVRNVTRKTFKNNTYRIYFNKEKFKVSKELYDVAIEGEQLPRKYCRIGLLK